MAILLWTTLLLALIAVVVTLCAVRGAKDGFEDELGFHEIAADQGLRVAPAEDRGPQPEPNLDCVPPYRSARAAEPLSKSLWASHT